MIEAEEKPLLLFDWDGVVVSFFVFLIPGAKETLQYLHAEHRIGFCTKGLRLLVKIGKRILERHLDFDIRIIYSKDKIEAVRKEGFCFAFIESNPSQLKKLELLKKEKRIKHLFYFTGNQLYFFLGRFCWWRKNGLSAIFVPTWDKLLDEIKQLSK